MPPAITIDQALDLACSYHMAGDVAAAEQLYEKIFSVNPTRPEVCSNLGVIARDRAQFEKAIEWYRRANAAAPEFAVPHWNLSELLLLLGHFEEGWQEREWRHANPYCRTPRRNFRAPRWQGEAIPGATLFVAAEEGSGDFLQFLRFLPLVVAQSRAARVLLECSQGLHRLIQSSCPAGVEIFTLQTWDERDLPACDYYVPLISLPLATRHFAPLPMREPYLRADREWFPIEESVDGLKVGVAWAGDPNHPDDRKRSIPLSAMEPLFSTGATFYSLQVNSTARHERLIDLTARIADFADTAALIAQLDLVITVDTAVAHLAGALGKKVWVLLPAIPDWRWGLEREDTPWYPTLRLFRQKTAGDWAEVIQRVAAELQAARVA